MRTAECENVALQSMFIGLMCRWIVGNSFISMKKRYEQLSLLLLLLLSVVTQTDRG